MTRRLRVAAIIFAAWTLYGFLLGQQVYALRAGPELTWNHALAYELSYCYSWALLTPLVWWIRRVFPLEGAGWLRRIPIHLVAAVLFAGMAQTGENLMLSVPHLAWFPQPTPSGLLRSVFMTLDYGAVLYWLVLLAGQLFVYFRRQNLDQVQRSELQAQLAEAQLQALRMQMHPHFLFNALNSVSELIHQNPRAADRMLLRLSDLLRMFLRSSEAQEVSLEREIEWIEHYLEIENIRFEDRLRVRILMDPRTLRALVPSLILQPLVENAVLHGIASREEGGCIEVQSCLQNGRIQLSVSDNGGNGDGGTTVIVEGMGLRNTRRRLATVYGRDHEFRVNAQPLSGVRAVMSFPFRFATEETAECA